MFSSIRLEVLSSASTSRLCGTFRLAALRSARCCEDREQPALHVAVIPQPPHGANVGLLDEVLGIRAVLRENEGISIQPVDMLNSRGRFLCRIVRGTHPLILLLINTDEERLFPVAPIFPDYDGKHHNSSRISAGHGNRQKWTVFLYRERW